MSETGRKADSAGWWNEETRAGAESNKVERPMDGEAEPDDSPFSAVSEEGRRSSGSTSDEPARDEAPPPSVPDRFSGSGLRRALNAERAEYEAAHRIGNYRVLNLLGQGGMGEVLLAEDVELGRRVALKLVRRELASNDAFVERFMREARLSARLNHPNIVTIHAIAREAEIPYLVLEFVEGDSLRDLLRRPPPIPLPTVLEYLAQACDGLGVAAKAGIVHRDVKPANIMVRRDGLVKVMDFGLSRSVESDQLTTTGSVIGTPDYMAPEQAAGERVDFRADIYSLGITIYQCVTGILPFASSSVMTILLRHRDEKLPSNPVLEDIAGGRLWRLVKEMTAKRPAERPDSFARIRDELRDIAAVVREKAGQPTCFLEPDSRPDLGREAGIGGLAGHDSAPTPDALRTPPLGGRAGRRESATPAKPPSTPDAILEVKRARRRRARHRARRRQRVLLFMGGGILGTGGVALVAAWLIGALPETRILSGKSRKAVTASSAAVGPPSAAPNQRDRPYAVEPTLRVVAPASSESGGSGTNGGTGIERESEPEQVLLPPFRTRGGNGTLADLLAVLNVAGVNLLLEEGVEPERVSIESAMGPKSPEAVLRVSAMAGGWNLRTEGGIVHFEPSKQPAEAYVNAAQAVSEPEDLPSLTLDTTRGTVTVRDVCEAIRSASGLDYLIVDVTLAHGVFPRLTLTGHPLPRVMELIDRRVAPCTWTVVDGILLIVPRLRREP